MFLLQVLLASCAMPGKIANEKLETSKNIAVVSLLGDTFHGVHIGGTVFNNEEYEASVPEWKIDALTEQIIIDHISKNNSRHASLLKRDTGLTGRFKKSFSFLNNGFSYDEIINLAKAQGADTVILVQPTNYENMPFHKPGYGFFERSLFSSKHGCIYSLFTVEVFSTISGKKAGWQWGFPCDSGETEIAWKDKFDKFTDDQKNLLRKKTEQNIRDNITKALISTGF